jgi:hypothetical protein
MLTLYYLLINNNYLSQSKFTAFSITRELPVNYYARNKKKSLALVLSVSGLLQYSQKCNKDSTRKRSLCTLRAESFPSLGKKGCDFSLYSFPNIFIYINVYCTVYCALYNVLYTIYCTVYCALYNVLYTIYCTVYCALYNVLYTIYCTVYCALYNVL